jgi:hypothetical protein
MITIIAAIATGFIAYRLGKRKGEADMYRLCYNAEESKKAFFSSISLR